MARVSSNWKLTFDPFGASPVVLLNFGDYTEDELTFPFRRRLEVIDITEGAAPFLRLSGNAACSIEFQRYHAESTDSAARSAMLGAIIETEAIGKKPLKVEVSGITDRFWLFSEAVVSNLEPSRWLETALPRVSRRYGITATGLSLQITTPGEQAFSAIAYPFASLTNSFATL